MNTIGIVLSKQPFSWSAILATGLFVFIVMWLWVRALRRTEDPFRFIVLWVLTGIVMYFMATKLFPLAARGGESAIFAALVGVLCAFVFAIIWRESIGSIVGRVFTSIYDGGEAEYEGRPVYSIARAKLARGAYSEAIAEIRKQLRQFPADFEGQLLLAQVQAEHMDDLPGAEITIQRLLQQEELSPRGLAVALNSLADWHLKFGQDPDAARQDLQQIINRLPDSEMSALAAQRIGHLSDRNKLLEAYDRKPIVLRPGVENIGLLSGEQQPKAPHVDPAAQIAEYVKHLEHHPLDTEAREKLAILYADYHRRLDLAQDQIRQLIDHPNQPVKRVVHWLNLLADLQIRHRQEYEAVRETLQEIIDRYPDSPAAQMALNRIDVLKLELKGREKSQTVKLGSYEQDIGLKPRKDV